MFENRNIETPVVYLGEEGNNRLYVKRDDLFPFSFGGNKARKGMLFWKDLKEKSATYIVTYGSSSSNHARVIANIAAAMSLPCLVISPEEIKKETFNKKLIESLGAEMMFCPVDQVSKTIDKTMEELKQEGHKPYFIMGGGHGNIGTQAYVECYSEICRYEKDNKMKFDYVFLASGTGTTQAGLIAGKILSGDPKKIVGISIARNAERGGKVVCDSLKEYLELRNHDVSNSEKEVIFVDDYISGGYGENNEEINRKIDSVMKKYGIPLDATYTGKAWYGMTDFLKKNDVKGKNILFVHTGGTPLYFDYLK